MRGVRGTCVREPDLIKTKGAWQGFLLPAWPTGKIVGCGTNGSFYTLGADKLPGGRGHGEPLRLMIDLGQDQEIVALFVHVPGRKLIVASHDGRGFVVAEDEVIAQTRGGKQVMKVAPAAEA